MPSKVRSKFSRLIRVSGGWLRHWFKAEWDVAARPMMTAMAISSFKHAIHRQRKRFDGKLGRFGSVVGVSRRSGSGNLFSSDPFSEDLFSGEVIVGSVRSSVHRPLCGSQFPLPLGHCYARIAYAGIAAPLVQTFDLMFAKCHDAATRSLRTNRRRPPHHPKARNRTANPL